MITKTINWFCLLTADMLGNRTVIDTEQQKYFKHWKKIFGCAGRMNEETWLPESGSSWDQGDIKNKFNQKVQLRYFPAKWLFYRTVRAPQRISVGEVT